MQILKPIYEDLRSRAGLPEIPALEAMIGYTFTDQGLLYQALTHSSAAQDYNILAQKYFHSELLNYNERLEFLGDAVLSLVITAELWGRGQNFSEGDLSKIRATLVNEDSLFLIAEKINLGQFILFGRSESASGGGQKKSILADALEALLAAIFCDGGFAAATLVIKHLFADQLAQDLQSFLAVDFKSLLQEYLQDKFKMAPVYSVVSEIGPSHQKEFTVVVQLKDKILAEGKGLTKKKASQEAARIAMGVVHAEKTDL